MSADRPSAPRSQAAWAGALCFAIEGKGLISAQRARWLMAKHVVEAWGNGETYAHNKAWLALGYAVTESWVRAEGHFAVDMVEVTDKGRALAAKHCMKLARRIAALKGVK